MNPLPITSCHLCDPESWVIERDSKYEYKCLRCKAVFKKLLKGGTTKMNQEDKEGAKAESLFEFYIAGVQYHKLHQCIKEIKEGDTLALVTEPTNKFDPNAVRVEFISVNQDTDFMLGYVPAKKGDLSAKVSAALMVKKLKCVVTEVNPESKPWEQLKVAIVEE